jgi:hypothetical protein
MMPRLSRLFAIALCAACVFSGQTWAQTASNTPQTSFPTNDDHLIESGSYINSAGNSVHRPAHTESGRAPSGASAQCRDGSFSFSQSHRGTCSHHGGVAKWL